MKKIGISIGDINGVGLEILLRAHYDICKICEPLYCVDREILENGAKIIGIDVPSDIVCSGLWGENLPTIVPARIDGGSGKYSYESFLKCCEMAENGIVDGIVTLPIHKKAWSLAGVRQVGHTSVLSNRYGKKSIMMLGCEDMFVALFSDHIALKDVSSCVSENSVFEFLGRFASVYEFEECCVMGLNPHCGDDGVIGDEDEAISRAIKRFNDMAGKEVFVGPISADSAFIPKNRERFRVYVSMYHDVGLSVLKALFFDESINVSLDIPIVRASVDHGVAFDIAYKNANPSTKSYLNAINFVVGYRGR